MKKLVIIAALVMAGVGLAYASSLSVPWFLDAKGDATVSTTPVGGSNVVNCGLPPSVKGIIGLVYLHNNQSVNVTCSIDYFDQDGNELGPTAPSNTFVITPKSTLAFRPVANDPASAGAGQEAPSGILVPNRPMRSDFPGGLKNNGSLVVTWMGGSTDVQGIYVQIQNVDGGTTGRLAGWGTLLPPGT